MAVCKEWLQRLSSTAQHPLPQDALQTWVGFQGVVGFDSWLQNLCSVPQFDLLFLFFSRHRGVRCNYILIGFFNALIYLKPAPMYPTPYSDEDEYML